MHVSLYMNPVIKVTLYRFLYLLFLFYDSFTHGSFIDSSSFIVYLPMIPLYKLFFTWFMVHGSLHGSFIHSLLSSMVPINMFLFSWFLFLSSFKHGFFLQVSIDQYFLLFTRSFIQYHIVYFIHRSFSQS